MVRVMKLMLCHLVVWFLVLVFMNTGRSQSIIKTLPGYPGPLPFKLETGYIGVGENDDEVQLFYYFFESEKNPERDPLLLWITWGPGCSGLTSLVYQIGPLSFDLAAFDFDGSLPSLVINPYSWTKWLLDHPKFVKNPLYIGGDSYGGKIAPMVALEIAKGNEAGQEPQMFFQGYIVGNAWREVNADKDERIPYAHRMALVSDEYFERARSSYHGKYVNPDPNNVQCLYALAVVNKCMDPVNIWHILEPKCNFTALKSNGVQLDNARLFIEDDPIDLIFLSKHEQFPCWNYIYLTSYVWAIDQTVQEALQVRKEKITDWRRCNTSLQNEYDYDVQDVLKHHQFLSEKGFQDLAYSADHDMGVPYLSTLKWIRELNLSLDDEWRPWTIDGQVAVYTLKYKNNQAYLTFATVKGAGHTGPEYNPKECFAMLERWLSSFPL